MTQDCNVSIIDYFCVSGTTKYNGFFFIFTSLDIIHYREVKGKKRERKEYNFVGLKIEAQRSFSSITSMC